MKYFHDLKNYVCFTVFASVVFVKPGNIFVCVKMQTFSLFSCLPPFLYLNLFVWFSICFPFVWFVNYFDPMDSLSLFHKKTSHVFLNHACFMLCYYGFTILLVFLSNWSKMLFHFLTIHYCCLFVFAFNFTTASFYFQIFKLFVNTFTMTFIAEWGDRSQGINFYT